MSRPTSTGECYRYDNWELWPAQRLLLIDGQPAKIGGRAFDLLVLLARSAGRVLSKNELLTGVWGARVVEENNLSVQITTLRRLLGDPAITNVAGVGYCFTATPAVVHGGESALREPGSTPTPVSGPSSWGSDLLGRDEELASISALLGQKPLLSIVGSGGVGKTCLARAVCTQAQGRWKDGEHWIDLAPVQPGTPLLPLISRALGVLPAEPHTVLAEAVLPLARIQALVVLDNCEHLLDSVAQLVSVLIETAPRLGWLTTSQEPLRVVGERVFRLDPLPVPPPELGLDEAQRFGALALLCQRVQASNHDFALDEHTLPVAVALCRSLDGLPLAIEMAAGRVASLGLAEVHAQIGQRLRLRAPRRDAPQRHQTLSDTYAWSHELLTPQEQRVFRRLQPFRGGFTQQMASRLVASIDPVPDHPDTGESADVLEGLLQKSLIHRNAAVEAGSPQRYRLLESARDFAWLQLQAAGESELIQRAHAERMAEQFARAWDEFMVSSDAEWAQRYLAERHNVAAALAWVSQQDEPATLASLVTACVLIDSFHCTESDVSGLALPLATLLRAPAAPRARACLELGWAHFLGGDLELGEKLISEALDAAESTRDVDCTYLSLTRLIRLSLRRPGREETAQALWSRLAAIDPSSVPLRLQLYAQSTVGRCFGHRTTLVQLQHLLEVASRAGYDQQAAICQTNVTDELLLQRRFEDAVEAARAAFRSQPGQLRLQAFVSYNEAHALVELGREDEARLAARRVLKVMPGQAHMVVDLFALLAARQMKMADAAMLAGFSVRYKRDHAFRPEAAEAALIDETQETLVSALEAGERQRLFDLGASMAVSEALRIAGLG